MFEIPNTPKAALVLLAALSGERPALWPDDDPMPADGFYTPHRQSDYP